MDRRVQEDHADLGLVEDDHTEDMRTAPVDLSVSALSGSRRVNSTEMERETHE